MPAVSHNRSFTYLDPPIVRDFGWNSTPRVGWYRGRYSLVVSLRIRVLLPTPAEPVTTTLKASYLGVSMVLADQQKAAWAIFNNDLHNSL